jgi:hypothetical protein
VTLTAIRYELQLGGTLLSEGTVGQAEVIPPFFAARFPLEQFIDNSRDVLLGELRKMSSVPYVISGEVELAPYHKRFELQGSVPLKGG